MFRRARRALTVGVAAISLLAVSPAAASAKNIWVAPGATHAPPGKSCSKPGYATIQSAIEAATPGITIKVCPSTYEEQLTIVKEVKLMATGAAEATIVSYRPLRRTR